MGIHPSTYCRWKRQLDRHGLSTRAKRYGLVSGYAAPPAPERPSPPPERHLDVQRPGQLVQLDCFCIGRLAGTKGGNAPMEPERLLFDGSPQTLDIAEAAARLARRVAESSGRGRGMTGLRGVEARGHRTDPSPTTW